MHRASNTFSVLQAIAATVTLALILWAMGVPSLRFAEAASVTDFSATVSTSEPNTGADYTIEFVSPNGVASSQSIVLTFDPAFDLSTIGPEDIDILEDDTPESIGGSWTVSTSSVTNSITIQSGGVATIAGGATTTILIGLHATNGTDSPNTPNSQIVNPGSTGSYDIDVSVGTTPDTGTTIVAVVDTVDVTAAVDSQFTFTVSGVAGGEEVNTADTTGGATTADEIPFGELQIGVASTAAQDLSVVTNAANGFVVTVVTNQQLTAGNGADIDGFRDGSFDGTPVAWASPASSTADENTWGHWGLTSDDPTIGESLSDVFNTGSGGDRFVSASTTPVEVFRHNGPTDGSGTGQGTARVGYKVEISALQEAANDYTATLTYVATPVF